ncbi:GATA-type zinc finger transcription factor [Mucor lusitanicus CBS 277.49]|uniref:GATA-type zinc finger transcription factor n=1 Tax=Mucor lusitanicus CBS 277.49 TaxID=747725 RepID=A0A168I2Q0_MUCCL|nr:GATA-type zinc finger transcription factor [Mucor lusitanicus CBS 277.49]
MACHVLSKNSSLSSDYQDWNIIDLVIYTATDDTVLAFFHNTDFGSCQFNDTPIASNPSCTARSDKACFDYEDALRLIQVLRLIQKTPITQMTEDQQLVSPIRIFQIIDSTTLKPLFVWPQLYSFVDMVQSLAKEIALKEFKSPSNEPSPNIAAATEDVSCTRHFYANSKIELFVTKRACEFQRILIPYGNILFESIQVTPLPTVAMTTSLGRPHTGMYMNSLAVCFDLQRVLKPDDEKEEVDRRQPSLLQQIHTNDRRPTIPADPGPRQGHLSQAHFVGTQSSIATASPIYSPSLHLRKFRIQQQQQHPQHDVAGRRRNLSCSSTEKKRRTDAFHGPVTTTTLPENVKTCTRCHTSNSPEWRRGPDGHKTLCNACGLRYSRFRSKQWRTATTNSSTSPPDNNSSFSSIK